MGELWPLKAIDLCAQDFNCSLVCCFVAVGNTPLREVYLWRLLKKTPVACG
jgi:hypothetical protein